MTSRISQTTLDVRDVDVMAAFWSAVLGDTVDMGDDGCAMLHPPQGGEPMMWLQAGASAKAAKLRCHIDLRTPDPAAEVDRLLALGARRGPARRRGPRVLADPEGNEFCVLHRPGPRPPGGPPSAE